MQRWCAAIEEEMSAWPDVTTRPMFGLMGYYRAGTMFAAIPRTRAVETPFSLLIKTAARDARLRRAGPGAAWRTLEMQSDEDIAEALRRLSRAYDTCRKVRRRTSR